jgi:hypothetical protein
MSAVPFTRPTIIAAIALIDRNLSQASFNHLVLRLGLENEITSNTAISVSKKADMLGRVVVQRPADQVDTLEGSLSLAEAVIREAVQLMRPEPVHEVETAFARGLARDGYVVAFDEESRRPKLRAALPDELGLPAVDDEVHELLKHFGLSESLGHLGQGIEAHARGDWAAANAQFRTFLEGLFDAIAFHEGADRSAQPTSENRRAWLAKIGYLAEDRNEWTQDGKNYINGLFKMLHTDGSHPGLSDEDHSTFRLHIVLVTARTFLRRLRYGQ